MNELKKLEEEPSLLYNFGCIDVVGSGEVAVLGWFGIHELFGSFLLVFPPSFHTSLLCLQTPFPKSQFL